ncbi:hypothetical protein ACOSP7_005337 [Xanthoceras sorbifolium]|uniref:Alpha/beta hydrolase fold-3 domain-containing protein n=1 Tax=Xanthoceras sorbifolium TaxID=99658 RepID=A0ABQ8IEW9_9ROSI|nr:hypothetical protein JRO89_XS02G0063100 [Xanthoceras sorbifolium]
MGSTDSELALDLSPMMRIYKDGRVERLMGTETVPPSFDPKTNVESKDIVCSAEHDLSVRLYLPRNTHQNQKLPLLVYFHGGSFLLGSAFSPGYQKYLNSLVSEANIIAVSVDYRLAPEHPLPAAYSDSWTALKWVASHVNQQGPEDWLNHHANFERVFLSGDSAGANIAHRMAIKHGHEEKLEVVNVNGIILCNPYFWGSEIIAGEIDDISKREKGEILWQVACPSSVGVDDPWLNPAKDPNLGQLGCSRVQVFVSEKDLLRERGWYYAQKLRESGWSGNQEVTDFQGEDHDFHLFKPNCEKAVAMLKSIVSFIELE